MMVLFLWFYELWKWRPSLKCSVYGIRLWHWMWNNVWLFDERANQIAHCKMVISVEVERCVCVWLNKGWANARDDRHASMCMTNEDCRIFPYLPLLPTRSLFPLPIPLCFQCRFQWNDDGINLNSLICEKKRM